MAAEEAKQLEVKQPIVTSSGHPLPDRSRRACAPGTPCPHSCFAPSAARTLVTYSRSASRAHDHLALAAKQGNLGAMDAWFELRKGEAAGGGGGGRGSVSDGDGGVGASVDAQRLRGGAGPLHYAVLHGHADVVDWLLAHGADPNLQNDNGATPLPFVATLGRVIRIPRPAENQSSLDRGFTRHCLPRVPTCRLSADLRCVGR